MYKVIKLDNGEKIFVDDNRQRIGNEGPVEASLKEELGKIGSTVNEEIKKIGHLASDIRKNLDTSLDEAKPNTIEIELGIEFSQELGCVVVNSTAAAQMKVRLVWERK